MAEHSNGGTSDRVATVPPSAASIAAMEELSPELRRLVWEAPIRISPLALAAVAIADGEAAAMALMRRNLRDELAAKSRDYRIRYGVDLPHVAAGIEPLSWDAKRGRPIPEGPVGMRAVRRRRRTGG